MIIINNGFNRGSFKGEPQGFVNLPVGTLFGRQHYKYWKKLTGMSWTPYTDLYYRPTQLEYENDVYGKLWFKTSNGESGWTYVGTLNPTGIKQEKMIPLLPPTMSLFYSDNVSINNTPILCGAFVTASNLTENYISTILVRNTGQQDFEIRTSSIQNGNSTYSNLVFDGSFPYKITPGSEVEMELTTLIGPITSSFGSSSYESVILMDTDIGNCSLSISAGFQPGDPQPITSSFDLFYIDSNDEFIEFECNDNVQMVSSDYTQFILQNTGDDSIEINSLVLSTGNTSYSEIYIYDPRDEGWWSADEFNFPYTLESGVELQYEIYFYEEAIINEFGYGLFTSSIDIETDAGDCSHTTEYNFQEPVIVPGLFYHQSGNEWVGLGGVEGGQIIDSNDSSYSGPWSLWVATSDTTRELVFSDDANNGTIWDLTPHFSNPVVTNIPGNNKKFFVTVTRVSSGTGLPVVELPTNVTIESLEGIATVENYTGMESKFSEIGFDWAKIKTYPGNELVKVINDGQWINIQDITNCNVRIALTGAIPSLPYTEPVPPPEPPANDDFINAEYIPFDFVDNVVTAITGSNALSTREANEPYPMDDPSIIDYSSYGGYESYLEYISASVNSVWWSFTTPVDMSTGYMNVNLQSSSFDTQMAIYTGSTLSNLDKITFSEDRDPDNADYTSEVTFAISPDTTYYVQVDGYYGSTGSVVLEMTKTSIGDVQYFIPDDYAPNLDGLMQGFVRDDFDANTEWESINPLVPTPSSAAGVIPVTRTSSLALSNGSITLQAAGADTATHSVSGIYSIKGASAPYGRVLVQSATNSGFSSNLTTHLDRSSETFGVETDIPFSFSRVRNGPLYWRIIARDFTPPLTTNSETSYTLLTYLAQDNVGPATGLSVMCMSDNGKYTVVAGPRYVNPNLNMYVLERTDLDVTKFVVHTVNKEGITSFSVDSQFPYNTNKISRNGILTSPVITPSGNATAVWKDGFNNPPVVELQSSAGIKYLWVSDSGLYTIGMRNTPTIDIIRTKLSDMSVEYINVDYQEIMGMNFNADRFISWSNNDPDGRVGVYQRGSDGTWTELGILLATNANADPSYGDWPDVTDMSGDGNKVIGYEQDSGKALIWDLSIPPVDGVWQATILGDPFDTDNYGFGGQPESISSDGTVIVGTSGFGTGCFWTDQDGFSTAHIMNTSVGLVTSGPSTPAGSILETYQQNTYDMFSRYPVHCQVSAEGRHVATNAAFNLSPTPYSEGLVFFSPTTKLSDFEIISG